MIYIQKGMTNSVILTLSEKSVLTNPNYMFIFRNEYDINSVGITFSTPDVSSYTNRYNQFMIVEDILGSKTGGYDIPLSLVSGQWSYEAYESLIPTLDILETTGRIIEEGRLVVSGIDDNIETISDSVYQ